MKWNFYVKIPVNNQGKTYFFHLKSGKKYFKTTKTKEKSKQKLLGTLISRKNNYRIKIGRDHDH